jgi:hypothetical protein
LQRIMRAFVARLRDSERAWSVALFAGLSLVLASGTQVGLAPRALLSPLAAAALGTLLALWVGRVSGLRRFGLAMALATLFTTPLLPYAFVENELTLPLLLLTTGFLALGPARLRPRLREVAQLAASAGVLLASSTGLLLLPLLVWLAWCGADRAAIERRADPKPGFYAAAALLLGVFAVRLWAIDLFHLAFASSPLDWLIHVHAYLLSLNKGLLLFAPLALLGLWRAFRGEVADRRSGRFALFTAASLIVPYAGLARWSDASWGPRPLLGLLAPALLALALSRTERARRGGHRRWILAATVCGLVVNTLGTAMPQSALAGRSGPDPATAAALPFDPAWNHPRVNAALLGEWLVATVGGRAARATESSPLVRPSPILLHALDPEGVALRPLALLLALLGALGWGLLIVVRHAAQA